MLKHIINFLPKRDRSSLDKTCRKMEALVNEVNRYDLSFIFKIAKEPILITDVPFRITFRASKAKIIHFANYVSDPRIETLKSLFDNHVRTIDAFWDPRKRIDQTALSVTNIYGLKLVHSKEDYFTALNQLLPDQHKLPLQFKPSKDQSVSLLIAAYSSVNFTTDPAIIPIISRIDPEVTMSDKPLIGVYAAKGCKEITAQLLKNGADPNIEYCIQGIAGNVTPLLETFSNFLYFSLNPRALGEDVDYPGTLEVLIKGNGDIHKTTKRITLQGVKEISLYKELIRHLHLILEEEGNFSSLSPKANCLARVLTVLTKEACLAMNYREIIQLATPQGTKLMSLIETHFPDLFSIIPHW